MKKHSYFLVFVFVGFLFSVGDLSCMAQEIHPTIEYSKENMMKIGLAIERFIQDTGVMLVDLNDDDNLVCLNRLANVFGQPGVDGSTRTRLDVLSPLVSMGYLDEIPADPFAPTDLFSTKNENEYKYHSPITYLYIDNEPDLMMDDFFLAFVNPTLKLADGEWVLVGYPPSDDGGPATELNYTRLGDTLLLLFSSDLKSAVDDWELLK